MKNLPLCFKSLDFIVKFKNVLCVVDPAFCQESPLNVSGLNRVRLCLHNLDSVRQFMTYRSFGCVKAFLNPLQQDLN